VRLPLPAGWLQKMWLKNHRSDGERNKIKDRGLLPISAIIWLLSCVGFIFRNDNDKLQSRFGHYHTCKPIDVLM